MAANLELKAETEGVDEVLSAFDKLSRAEQAMIAKSTAANTRNQGGLADSRKKTRGLTDAQRQLNSAMSAGRQILGSLGIGFGAFEIARQVISDIKSELAAVVGLQERALGKQGNFATQVAKFTKSTALDEGLHMRSIQFAKELGPTLGEGGAGHVLDQLKDILPKTAEEDIDQVFADMRASITGTGKYDREANFAAEVQAGKRLGQVFGAPEQGANLLQYVVAGGGSTFDETIEANPAISAAAASAGDKEAAALIYGMFQTTTKADQGAEQAATQLQTIMGRLSSGDTFKVANSDQSLTIPGTIKDKLEFLTESGKTQEDKNLIMNSIAKEGAKGRELLANILSNPEAVRESAQTILAASRGERDFTQFTQSRIEQGLGRGVARTVADAALSAGTSDAGELDTQASAKAEIAASADRVRGDFGLRSDADSASVIRALFTQDPDEFQRVYRPKDQARMSTGEFREQEIGRLLRDLASSLQDPADINARGRRRLEDPLGSMPRSTLLEGVTTPEQLARRAVATGQVSGGGGVVTAGEERALNLAGMSPAERDQFAAAQESGNARQIEQVVAAIVTALQQRMAEQESAMITEQQETNRLLKGMADNNAGDTPATVPAGTGDIE